MSLTALGWRAGETNRVTQGRQQMGSIADEIMGDVWPAAQPGPDAAVYATSTLCPNGRFVVRSCHTFKITITIGEYGLDDTGAVKIVQRWTHDGGAAQCDDPAALNYVSAQASNGAQLTLHMERYPHQRPWYNGIRITLSRGYMSPGDTIEVVLGDTSGGSPGYRLQTFCEAAFEFRVLADVCATGVFLPIASHTIEIGPGPVSRWVLAAPTLRRVGEAFSLGVRGEDHWGNASDQTPDRLFLEADGAVSGMPQEVTLARGARGTRIAGLSFSVPGTYRFILRDESGRDLARSNPVVIKAGGPAAYWGDLHGQSGETVGIDTLDQYLRFARDVAFLDVASHQANDFQITNAFWAQINARAAEFNQDGSFVIFPGYEWSGNTPVGGDHNVFFAQEGEQIHRSSHALLDDRTDINTDAPTVEALFDALEGRDCVVFAHVGGRPADIARAENARLRTAVEVHSDWGTFEWMMTDAFDLGYRVGLVCNSDGHKGAPGACYPGASEFGAYSGLTCFLSDTLSRPAIFDALRKRRHYGTTGCRMHLDVQAHLGAQGAIYSIDPRIRREPPVPATLALMGDIARLSGASVDLQVSVETPAPIERVDILNGHDVVKTFRPYRPEPHGRLRILWEGAEYRGRGRTTHWTGTIAFDEARIRAMTKINIWNHDRRFVQNDDQTIAFDAVTTGNFGGCDIWLDRSEGSVHLDTPLVSGRFSLASLGADETQLEAGGLGRKLRLFRLPEKMTATHLSETCSVDLVSGRDNPLWVRVTTEDGFVGWSSPIYVIDT